MKANIPIGIPIICSLVSFILAMLVIFAGKDPGFMEDYHIIMLNTSELGKNLVPTPTSDGGKPSSTGDGCGLPGALGKLCGSATSEVASVASKAAKTLGDIEDDIADELASKLGIHEFYSLHVMDACEGYFSPNTTAKGAKLNVTKCTEPLKTGQYNITRLFDHELSLGPLDLNLADLGFTKDMQKVFDHIAQLLLALSVIYIIATAFTGLSLLGSVAAVALTARHARAISITNLTIAALAALLLLVGNLVATIGAKTAAHEIDDKGRDIGLRASSGGKFIALAWATFALMAVAAGYWVWEFRRSKGHRRMEMREKYENRNSVESQGRLRHRV